jgi:hypothetical protein
MLAPVVCRRVDIKFWKCFTQLPLFALANLVGNRSRLVSRSNPGLIRMTHRSGLGSSIALRDHSYPHLKAKKPTVLLLHRP